MARIHKQRSGIGPKTDDRRDHGSRLRLLARIREEFEALPALRLTAPQVSRLFALRPDVCSRVLARLVQDNALSLSSDGRYTRRERDQWQGPGNPPWSGSDH